MKTARRVVAVLAVFALLVPLAPGTVSAGVHADISYSVLASGVEIRSANATVLISTTVPAASVRTGDLTNHTGDGFVLRSFIGYNATGTGFAPSMTSFIAPTSKSAWTLSGPWENETPQGRIVTVSLRATLDMMAMGTAGGMMGMGGPMYTVHDWAEVTVRFQVSAYDYTSACQNVHGSPLYAVNGSSELKFDISMAILKPLPVNCLALQVALMKMDGTNYTPSTSSGSYGFMGYQAGGMISRSNPKVNETQNSMLAVHQFQNRERLKQTCDFVNWTGAPDGYFSWARQAATSTAAGTSLANVSASYRTDGESLAIYLSTPVTLGTLAIDHDPSIGVFGGTSTAPVALPGLGALGPLLLAIVVGAAAGGVGVYMLSAMGEDRDPASSVVLEKNRYYRKRR